MIMNKIEHLSDSVTLYLGDCREILPTLPKVDAVVTDPPYGIAYVKGTGGGQGAYRGRPASESRHIEPVTGDDRPFDPAALLKFENVLMWGANHYCHELPRGVGRWIAWNKLGDIESFDSFSDVEFAWHSKGRSSRIFNYMWKGGLACVKAGEDKKRSHPTQKPIGLMCWCIELVGDATTILDPFMGSGTTGVAAVSLGRKFIGIEIEPKYFDIACRRIGDELRRPRLALEPPAPPPKQEALGL